MILLDPRSEPDPTERLVDVIKVALITASNPSREPAHHLGAGGYREKKGGQTGDIECFTPLPGLNLVLS